MRYVILLLLLIPHLGAATRYVAQSAGTFSGGSACNGQTAITPTTFNGLTLTAGDTTYLCGTITGTTNTTLLTISQSGSSGNVISLIFDTGALLSAPYWGLTGAVAIAGNFILIDGGANGTITATANGTSLSNPCSSGANCNSKGIYMASVHDIEVRNLIISNIYVHVCGTITPPFSSCTDNSGTQGSAGIYCVFGNHLNFHHNTVSEVYAGIEYIYEGSTTSTDINIHHNIVTNTNWSVMAGSGATNAILTVLQINNNNMNGWDNWNDSANQYHHNAVFIFTQAAGDIVTNPVVNANTIGSVLTLATSAVFIDSINASTDAINGAMISNNIIINPVSNTTGCPNGYIVFQAPGGIAANNTILASYPGGCSGDSGNGNDGILVAGAGSGFSYFNNIITNCSYGLISDVGVTISASDYNDIYNCTNYGIKEPDPAKATLSAWRSAYSSLDAHSISTDPNLNSSTYRPNSGSPVVGAGTNLTATYCGTYPLLCSDYAGVTRPSSGTWDIGAYQFQTASTPTSPLTRGILMRF